MRAAKSQRRRPQPRSVPPQWWAREFKGEPSQVAEVRSWIAQLFPADDALDVLVLIASELVTNAIEHTLSGRPGGRFTVDLARSAGSVRMSVGDQGSSQVPTVSSKTGSQVEDDEAGRGLFLVDTLAAAWGRAGDVGWHWVWADVHWPAGASGTATMSGRAEAAEQELAMLRRAYPGSTGWYGPETRTWCGSLPGAAPDRLLSASSLSAFGQLLAARYVAASPAEEAEGGRGRMTIRLLAAPVGSDPEHLRPGDSIKTAEEGTPMALICSCGYAASSRSDLADHLGEAFIRDDDIAPDGRSTPSSPVTWGPVSHAPAAVALPLRVRTAWTSTCFACSPRTTASELTARSMGWCSPISSGPGAGSGPGGGPAECRAAGGLAR